MKKLLFCLLLVSPLVFSYESKELTYIPATSYELAPGEATARPLDNADVQGWNLYCNGSLKQLIPDVSTEVPRVWTSPDGSFPAGDYACHLTTVLLDNTESGGSNIVNFTVAPSLPEAPTNFTVTLP